MNLFISSRFPKCPSVREKLMLTRERPREGPSTEREEREERTVSSSKDMCTCRIDSYRPGAGGTRKTKPFCDKLGLEVRVMVP